MRLRRYDPSVHDPVDTYRAVLAGRLRMVHLGMWQDPDAARAVLEWLWRREGIPPARSPQVCNLPWVQRHRLTGLLRRYRNSPYLLLTSLYPGRWQPVEFRELPFARDLNAQALEAQGLPPDAPPLRRRRLTVLARARTLGRCVVCHGDRPPDRPSLVCAACQRAITESLRDLKHQRVRQGKCAEPGCPHRPLHGLKRCEYHLNRKGRAATRTTKIQSGGIDHDPRDPTGL